MSWRLGIATGVCTTRPILDVLPLIRSAGAEGVEIGTPPAHFNPWNAKDVDAVLAGLDHWRLSAVSIHAPFGGSLDLADPNPDHRRQAIDAVMTAASALRRFGGRLVVVHPSDLRRHDHDAPSRLHDSAHSLSVLADRCARQDQRLVVETPLPHLIGGDPEELAFLLGRLPPDVGVCADTGHTFLGRHWHRVLEVAGPRLAHVHASDNHGTRDDHLAPGDGAIDWADVARSLRAARFSGWIMLELSCVDQAALNGQLAHAFRRGLALLQP